MTQRRRVAARLEGWFTRYPLVLPLVILFAGAVFRYYNLNWDNGHQLHPDERWIYEVVSGANNNPPLGWPHSWAQAVSIHDPTGGSPLNPHSFQYGSLPFYLLAFIAGTLSWLGAHIGFLSSWSALDTYSNLPLLGRGLSATIDLLSVLLVFLLGRRVYGYWQGVLAMAFTAFTVLNIQLSHFFTVDTVLLPLCLLTLLAATRIAQDGSRGAYLWAGVALGAALATKTTALLLVVPLGSASILAAWSGCAWRSEGALLTGVRRHYAAVAPALNRNLLRLVFTFLVAAGVFVLLEPYAVLDRTQLLIDLQQQTSILVTNNPPFYVPYTIQYAHTIPYVYQIANILFWSMGMPLALAAYAGVLFACWQVVRLRIRPDALVLLLWVIPYFLFVGSFFAKFNRYMLPILPVIALFGAALLVSVLRSAMNRIRLAGGIATVAVLLGTLLYAVAYMNIYAQPNTRIAASRWIFTHIPAGTSIAVEGPWDDPLPMDELRRSSLQYHTANLDLYAGETALTDSTAAVNNITDVLMHDRYIIMSSERMIGSIPKLPLQFPIATRYYQLLFSGRLNFRLLRVFQVHPQLGPVVVHDYSADESFHVYDHPIVRIWQRTGPISAAEAHTLLTTGLPSPPPGADLAALPAILRPKLPPADHRLMLSGAQWKADQQGGTYDSMFPAGGFAMQHPILVWLVLLELLGLVAFPFTFGLLSRLMDRGFVAAKTVGLLLMGYLVWIAVSTGLATYDRGVIYLAIGVMILASALLAYGRRVEMLAVIRRHWRYMAAGEVVFLVTFAAFILLRMWYPDLGHQFSPVATGNIGSGRMGEKQMELAFINAIVRSRVFPPYDPFFGHGYINYYYYGFYLVGTLCKLTQIAPATGFNLAIATFFALLVATIFSAGLNLTRRIFPGVLAAVFVGAIGNLNGGWQVVTGLMGVASVHSSVPLLGGIADVLSGLRAVLFDHAQLPPFDYWGPSRIIPPTQDVISEFPLFSYLFADLHPHVIAYPITALAILVAIQLVRGGYRRWPARVGAVILGGMIVGSLAVTNPWDYPTYLAIVALGALCGAYAVRRRLTFGLLARPVLWGIGMALVTYLLYLPFKQSYATIFATGIGLVRDVTPASLYAGNICGDSSSNCPAAIHDALVTPLRIYLEHFGFLLFAVLSYLIVLITAEVRTEGSVPRAMTYLRFLWYYRDRLPAARRAAHAVSSRRKANRQGDWLSVLAMVALLAVMCGLGYFLLAFLLAVFALVSVAFVALGRRLPASQLFILGMITAAILLSILTQIVFVKDWLAGGVSFRMNTIFKFYDQVWVLFALSGATGLYYFMLQRLSSARSRGERVHRLAPNRSFAPWLSAHITLARRDWQPAMVPSVAPVSTGVPTGEVEATTTRAISPASREAPAVRDSHRSRKGVRLTTLLERNPFWTAAFAVLLAGSLIYTYAGTVSRETVRSNWLPAGSVPLTLDGMAFMKVAYPGDYAAIKWLNSNVRGAPVIAEAGGAYYDWRSRVSMFTGLPTIIDGIHEAEQRYADELDPTALCNEARDTGVCLQAEHSRAADLQTLYDSANPADAWRVIHQYGVRYIYVGTLERQCIPSAGQCYSHAGLHKFTGMVGHGLRIAYRNGDVIIYQVVGA